MSPGRGAGVRILEEQRRAVERLKSTLFGADPYVRRRYIRDFHKEFRSGGKGAPRESLIAACLRSDLILVGDYHALPACQHFAVELLRILAPRSRRLVLFVEMIFARDQRILDEYLAGAIDADQLRRRIRYERDWGYSWEGYGALLKAARETGVSVCAVDAPPRGGLKLIRQRDRHAARLVAERLTAEPDARGLVLFGESHVARNHLPREIKGAFRNAGLERSSIVIVQNVEHIYWSLVRGGGEVPDTVRIDGGRWCVYNASPLAKYEAYRQTLLGWAGQADDCPDYLPSVHHLIDLLVASLAIDRYRFRVPTPGGRLVPLIDLYPDVVVRLDRRRRGAGTATPRRRRSRPGVVYRPGANRIDIFAFTLASAAEAVARFLLLALAGRVGEGARRAGPRATGAMRRRFLEEAFVAFAVRYLDPSAPPPPGRLSTLDHSRARRRQARREPRGRIHGSSGDASGWELRSLSEASERGRALGERLYVRSLRSSRGDAIRRWLADFARGDCRGPDGVRSIETLMTDGIRLAGWTVRHKRGGASLRPPGGTPRAR